MAGSAIVRTSSAVDMAIQLRAESCLPQAGRSSICSMTLAVRHWMRAKPDVVVLAAATVGGIEANRSRPADFLLENLRIETQVIEAAWRPVLGDYCFWAAAAFTRNSLNSRFERKHCCGRVEPTNAWYAIAKIAGIKLCEALRLQHGFDAISLMPTNLYGPGDNYHPREAMCCQLWSAASTKPARAKAKSVTCWGTGKPLREFLHADDLGEACVFAGWSIGQP